MKSLFDAEFSGCDRDLMATFGAEYQLQVGDAEPVPVMVDIETGLNQQELGERGRPGNAQRLGAQMLGIFLAADVPADIAAARLHVDGTWYRLTEPQHAAGEVEFLLLPETADVAVAGSHTTAFFNG